MKAAVHTRLLGDVTAAIRRLPFAQTRLGIMFREHQQGPASRAIARHFNLEGDTIDLWVDSLGGRITITAGALGHLREYGMAYGQWRLFSQGTLLELPARRTTLAGVDFPAGYGPQDATAAGFLGYNAGGLVRHDAAGAARWTFGALQAAPTRLPGNNAFVGSQGLAFAGGYVVFADGTESKSQVRYEDYPFNLNVLGYQLAPATLRYGRVALDAGDGLLEAPTYTATVWGGDEPVFAPVKLAGASPLLPNFHAIGFLWGVGSDEDSDRLVVLRHELHHVDTSDLSTRGTVALSEQPRDLIVDHEGTVYVRFDGNPGRFEAYTRDLARVPAKDFTVAAADLSVTRDTVAIAGNYLFSKVEPVPGFWRLKKIARSGTVVADVAIPFSLTSTASHRLVLIRT